MDAFTGGGGAPVKDGQPIYGSIESIPNEIPGLPHVISQWNLLMPASGIT